MSDSAAGTSAPLVLDIIGVRVAVRVPPADRDALRAALAPIVVAPSAMRPEEVAGAIDVDVTTAEEVLGQALLAAIEHSPHLLVHAGAVASHGGAVLFPGVSGAGKSTMTAACLLRGFEYLSDEAVAVDLGSGHVRGLSRPLMLTAWSVDALRIGDGSSPGKHALPAEVLGASTASGPLPVGHIVVVRQGAAATALAPMSRGAALAVTLASSFNHYKHEAAGWAAATRMVEAARCWSLNVADPRSGADAVADLFERLAES